MNATNDSINSMRERLNTLQLRLRAAFAAGCVERILVIYEYCAERPHPSVRLAVEIVWAFVEGQEIAPNVLPSLKKKLEEASPDLEVGGGPELFSYAAAQCAVDAICDSTAISASRAAANAVAAISEFYPEGVSEEEDWQQKALNLVISTDIGNVNHKLFDEINRDRPGWYDRMAD